MFKRDREKGERGREKKFLLEKHILEYLHELISCLEFAPK
jgi:hypothetical protein